MAHTKGKRKTPGSYDFEEGHMQLSVPTVKRVNFTSTSDSGSYSSSSVLGTLPTTSAYPTVPTTGIPKAQPNSDGPEAVKNRTQNAELLEDLGEIFDDLGQLMLEFEFDASIGTLCQCLKAQTPHHLRHCNQSQRTLDGNFQCNQFNKNTDPDDISLCAGKGYFPPDDEYKAYLAKIPVSREDKNKFKNMAVTGTVNCQCSHVFILSSVDLHLGERFANTDAALAREIRQHKPSKEFEIVLRFEVDDIDKVTTYDIACEYFIYLESRFQQHFPDLVEDVKSIRWGVPSLHVQGHQDSCNYLFGTAYMECVGHFHGETAEHYWPEANQLGPHVRQMNNGHRQDTLIIHHGDWNHKKTMKLAVTLANDIALAQARYIEKRDHFIGLTVSFQDRIDGWRALDRTTSKKGNEVISLYKHRTSKVPSQRAIYQAMLAQDETFQSSFTPKSKIARFLNDALRIQDDQRRLRVAIEANIEHNLETTQKEVLSRRTKLGNTILAWRQQQKSIAPKLGDTVATQAAVLPAVLVEEEVLFLPSDLTASERLDLDVVALGVEEVRWREGEAFDALRAVQNVVKALVALRDRKTKNERQQKDNTRAGNEIADTTRRRDRHMQTYDAARRAMIALGALTDGPNTSFPPLTVADTFMKSVRQTRRIGDSKFTDGLLWRVSGGNVPGPSLVTSELETSFGESAELSGTQMHTRKSAPRMKVLAPGTMSRLEEKREERPEGWLWQLGKMGRLSQNEMDEWSSEGDRVQWFRAEAEMQRWQEQKEQKLIELLRTVRSFFKMQQVWTQLANGHSSNQPGHAAYARQKSSNVSAAHGGCTEFGPGWWIWVPA
ncbi:CxC2 domain-containing protein [Mycena venus]|uniref:CxC2 domain-containing protein n=1 Tax=Mycena venus TaxID=2733690 RepID=A0A8H6Z5B0_9AGAR|nr:CxC2 domain-containing protein [Mycena venus]